MRCCIPPSINDLIDKDVDVVNEIVPDTVEYKYLEGGAVKTKDYRDRLVAEIKAKWGDYPLCYRSYEKWVKIVKPYFSPEKMDRYGFITGMYSAYDDLDRTFTEYTIQSDSNVESTESREDEDMPDTPVDNEKYLSARGKTVAGGTTADNVHYVQKSGPPRLSRSVYEDMTDAWNPVEKLVTGMGRFFIPLELLDECLI